jgi:hypothetical protein
MPIVRNRDRLSPLACVVGYPETSKSRPPGASRKFGTTRGSKLFFQTNRKGRWASGPCLNLVNQIRCDVQLCASTLRTRKSESQYRQGLTGKRDGAIHDSTGAKLAGINNMTLQEWIR